MGSVGDAYDNAMCESYFATLECELLDRQRSRTQADARLAVFDFIEGWYNPRRRHSALDYLSPMIYERSRGISDRTVPSGSTIDTVGAISVPPSERASDDLESSSPSTEPGQVHRAWPAFLAICFRCAAVRASALRIFLLWDTDSTACVASGRAL
jgi:hypothetical protein